MLQPRQIYIRRLQEGTLLEAEVSPCVFMYPNYPLQLTVTLRFANGVSGGVVCPSKRGLVAATATEADVKALLESVGICPCQRCRAPAFDPLTVNTNRNGLCEACFTGDLQANLERELELEGLQLAVRDRRQRAQGMKYRVTAWIHADSGDDEMVDWYFGTRPTESFIRRLLADEGSEILDDFEIIAL